MVIVESSTVELSEIDELSIVEFPTFESETTVEQFLTVESVMVELSEIDELSIVELSSVELSRT